MLGFMATGTDQRAAGPGLSFPGSGTSRLDQSVGRRARYFRARRHRDPFVADDRPPIRRIAEVLLSLAGGRKAVVIPYQDRRDEVATLRARPASLRTISLRMQELEAEQKRSVEDAAVARRNADPSAGGRLRAVVGAIVTTVDRRHRRIAGTAKSLTETAEVTHQLANSVSIAATEASKNVRSVAVASDQLASSIAEIGQQAEHSRDIAGEAVQRASRTHAQIAQMSQVAGRIGHVLSLINEIAARPTCWR